MSSREIDTLPFVRAAELEAAPNEHRWLVEQLWTRQAVGVIGGRPKHHKSWLGLEMAVSVASGIDCLGCFPVHDPGSTIVYLAEDAHADVRERIDGVCQHRQLDFERLPLFVITVPVLRLDREQDRARLAATVARVGPRLLLLDPLIRLHRLDENHSGDIAGLLGFLRELQRTHHVAIAIVHHMSKRRRADLGQALRGSSDLHAWTDSSAYLTRQGAEGRLMLTTEHRSAPAPEPLEIALVSAADGTASHLEIVGPAPAIARGDNTEPLDTRIIAALRGAATSLRRSELRRVLQVNNQRLGDALAELCESGVVERNAAGWRLPHAPAS